MYAVISRVDIDPTRAEEAHEGLLAVVVPAVKERPGLQGAYWFRSLDRSSGMSFELYDTEEAAQAIAANPPQVPPDGPVKFADMGVYTVEHSI